MPLGSKQRGNPSPRGDYYANRSSAALDIYNAEPEKPATSYATSTAPGFSRYAPPTIRPKVRAFFKDSHWRLDGIINAWSWGGVDQGANTASLPYGGGMDGTVRSTQFQRTLIQLHDWSQNLKWYIAWNGTGGGVFSGSNPARYNYPSFRVPQINTRTSGGPGPVGVRMQPRPRYTAVQRVPKYTVQQRYYNTTSRNSGWRKSGGSSSTNGTGL